jgi:ubiquinone/menaquinone biosynthesis C-methylase UbiE
MTTKSPDPNELSSVIKSADVAEQWRVSRARRGKVNEAANEMLLELANLSSGNRVLDVAAGTGDQTLMAAERVGPTGYVLATDISANMLKLAADAAREEGLTNVDVREMDAETLISTKTLSTLSYAGRASCSFPIRSKRLPRCDAW